MNRVPSIDGRRGSGRGPRARGNHSITPQELHRRWRSGTAVEIIDVRSPADFALAHVPTARSVPFESLDPGALMASREGPGEAPLYVICQVGQRSADACERFLAAGFTHAVNVEGGTRAWQRSGLPVVAESRALSRRRQARVAGGILVLAGAALGLAASPYLALLLVVAGGGLILGLGAARSGASLRAGLRNPTRTAAVREPAEAPRRRPGRPPRPA